MLWLWTAAAVLKEALSHSSEHETKGTLCDIKCLSGQINNLLNAILPWFCKVECGHLMAITHIINARTRDSASHTPPPPVFVYLCRSLHERCMRQVVSLWCTLISNHSLVLLSRRCRPVVPLQTHWGLNNKWVHHIHSSLSHNSVYQGNVQGGT